MNMINKVELMQAENDFNVFRVCDLLGWNRDHYHQHQFDTGMQYLEKYYNGDQEAIRRMSSCVDFWSWFKNLWNARNKAFREEWDGTEDLYDQNEFRAIYFDIHRSAVMSAEIAPPRSIYPKDFPTIKIEMA